MDMPWKNAVMLAENVPSFKCLRLRRDDSQNAPEYLSMVNGTLHEGVLNLNDHYVVLGEVENTKHYIVVNINKGIIVPGMLHLNRFERVPEDEL